MANMRVRISVPEEVRRGEVFPVRTLASHPMDNGFMYSRDGVRIPRRILHRFEARYNGELFFRADWHEAVAENPFLSFHAVATESGHIDFRWYDDDGTVHEESVPLRVV